MELMRGFKFKLKLNVTQLATIERWVGVNRCLYNMAVLQRTMNDYRQYRIGYKEQAAELKTLKKDFPWIQEPPAQTLQQTLKHVDYAFQSFFRGQSEFPKLRKKRKGIGIKFPTPSSIKILTSKNPKKGLVELPKIGLLRFRKSRNLDGEIRSCTITKYAGSYHISFLCKIELSNPIPPLAELGIYHGINYPFAFSSPVEGKRFLPRLGPSLKSFEGRIRRFSKHLNTKIRYSKNWLKIRLKVQRLRHRIAYMRRDFLWKLARTVTKNHGTVVLEDMKMKRLRRLHHGWYTFSVMLEHKSQDFGGKIIKIVQKKDTFECAQCQTVQPRVEEENRIFLCLFCQHEEPFDLNQAKIILARGRRVLDALKA